MLPDACRVAVTHVKLRKVKTTIRRLVEADVDAVVAFSLEAWAPVFAGIEAELGREVYRMVYPDWRSAQAGAVESACTAPENDVWVAVADACPVGFVVICFVKEDTAPVGEIHMLAVDPDHQGAGVGASLVHRAVAEIKARGIDLAVVATGGDPGHAPARALYEKLDFNAFRQVRYYRRL